MAFEEVREALSRTAASAGPRVVGIGRHAAHGSGVVIGPGRVLTNAHNLRGEQALVTFADGRTATATPVGVDLDGDLAVLSVETAGAAPIEWAQANGVGIGTPVFALANPGGQGLRVTHGYVSGTQRSFRGPRGRRIAGSLEHTAPLLPGSSGGPIVDGDGRLLGINTNRLGEGFYLAIPADEALRERVEALEKGSAPERPRLGIGIAPGHVARRLRRAVGLPERDGLLVRQVDPDSPAARAGIAQGDLIVSAAGRSVSSADDLFDALESSGQEMDVTVVRGTEERTVKVALR
jgi:serine protease Do